MKKQLSPQKQNGRATRATAAGAALATLALAGLGTALVVNTTATPAQAQRGSGGIERALAGIRLNSSSRNVLARFGNPDQVVVGEVGIRTPAGAGGAPTGAGGGTIVGGGDAAPGIGDAPGGGPGGYGARGGYGGSGGSGGYGARGGGSGGSGGYGGGRPGGVMSGSGPGAGAGPAGDLGGAPGGDFGGSTAGGFGGFGGAPQGGGVGAFGQTTSALARQQEVTWIYNRKVKGKKGPNLVSYEFLIGPNGRVIQIRTLGYSGGIGRTARGIALGASYKELIQRYGYPELHQQAGPVMVASYRSRTHAEFQLLNNRVIAITIATIE